MGAPNQSMQQARQLVRLRRRLGGDVLKLSEFHNGRVKRAELNTRLPDLAALAQLAPMRLDDVRSTGRLALAPTHRRRRYRVLRWLGVQDSKFVIGYSHADLITLAKLGQQSLLMAGLTNTDTLADLSSASPTRNDVQIVSGAARLGIPVLQGANNVDALAGHKVSACWGPEERVAEFLELLVDLRPSWSIHTAIVSGLPAGHADRLAAAANALGVAVVRLWAPEGVMAGWMQCRGGDGLHTWPNHELIEVIDPLSGLASPNGRPGRLVWSGLAWWASAMVRLDTAAAGELRHQQCEACGRPGPVVIPHRRPESFSDYLSGRGDIKRWAAELHRGEAGDELAVWISMSSGEASPDLVEEIYEKTSAARITITSDGEVYKILQASNGEPFGDRRAFAARAER